VVGIIKHRKKKVTFLTRGKKENEVVDIREKKTLTNLMLSGGGVGEKSWFN